MGGFQKRNLTSRLTQDGLTPGALVPCSHQAQVVPLVPGTGRQPVLGRCQDKGGPVAGTLRGRAEGPGAEAKEFRARLQVRRRSIGSKIRHHVPTTCPLDRLLLKQ